MDYISGDSSEKTRNFNQLTNAEYPLYFKEVRIKTSNLSD